jgi:general secretion pathway protein F
MHLPVIGPILRDSALARLTRSMNLMLAAGVPLALALRDTGTHLSADVFSAEFLRAADAVESGDRASAIFAITPALPVMFRELFEIGEQTNNLAPITDSIATVLEDGVERQSQKAVQLVTPLLTLVMGGGLALLVYTIMDAILSVNDLAF